MVYVPPHLLKSVKEEKVPIKPTERRTIIEDDTVIATNTPYPPLVSLGVFSCAHALEFTKPTPVQRYAIPILEDGQPLLVRAPTGMGKTLCFLLPIIERIKYSCTGIQACIITPTRELAIQIHEEALKITTKKRINIGIAHGSQKRLSNYRTSDILVATPGRLLDYLKSGSIVLKTTEYLVLDEADKLLEMGFEKDIRAIKSYMKEAVKVCLFSATYHKNLEGIIRSFLPADRLYVEIQNETVKNINQEIIEIDNDVSKKDALLRGLLSKLNLACPWKSTVRPDKVILFVERKIDADKLKERLRKLDFKCESLHGDKDQGSRTAIFSDFKSGEVPILVATSVAARGIDVKDVKLVVNFSFPGDIKEYIHRIGRTGREGKKGWAVTFLTPRNITPELCQELIGVLKESGNKVPEFLIKLAHAPLNRSAHASESLNKSVNVPRSKLTGLEDLYSSFGEEQKPYTKQQQNSGSNTMDKKKDFHNTDRRRDFNNNIAEKTIDKKTIAEKSDSDDELVGIW